MVSFSRKILYDPGPQRENIVRLSLAHALTQLEEIDAAKGELVELAGPSRLVASPWHRPAGESYCTYAALQPHTAAAAVANCFMYMYIDM